jgi:sugar (pentulose or hexulose) kinase
MVLMSLCLLKLTRPWPCWLQPFSHMLPPRCVPPGSPVACVTPEVADRTGLPSSCVVAAGTTDSIAAFLAAGVREPGHAVTSLGLSHEV